MNKNYYYLRAKGTILIFFFLIFSFSEIAAQTRNMYWRADATNNNLHNPSNWEDENGDPIQGAYPGKDDNVFFTVDWPGGSSFTIEDGDVFQCRNITCTSGKAYDINSKVTLRIYGNIDINDKLTSSGTVEMVNADGDATTEFTIKIGYTQALPKYFGSRGFYIKKPGKTVSLLSDVYTASTIRKMELSTFNANGYTLSVYGLYTDVATDARIIDFRNSKLITTGPQTEYSCFFGANTTYLFDNSEFVTGGMRFNGANIKFNILRGVVNSYNNRWVWLRQVLNTSKLEIDSLIIEDNVLEFNVGEQSSTTFESVKINNDTLLYKTNVQMGVDTLQVNNLVIAGGFTSDYGKQRNLIAKTIIIDQPDPVKFFGNLQADSVIIKQPILVERTMLDHYLTRHEVKKYSVEAAATVRFTLTSATVNHKIDTLLITEGAVLEFEPSNRARMATLTSDYVEVADKSTLLFSLPSISGESSVIDKLVLRNGSTFKVQYADTYIHLFDIEEFEASSAACWDRNSIIGNSKLTLNNISNNILQFQNTDISGTNFTSEPLGGTWKAPQANDLGGNTGTITFTGVAPTAVTYYWLGESGSGSSGNWSNPQNWSVTSLSGAAQDPTGCLPTRYDHVVIGTMQADAEITIDIPAVCYSITWTDASRQGIMKGEQALTVFGDADFSGARTEGVQVELFFSGNGTHLLTSAATDTTYTADIYFNGSGAYTLNSYLGSSKKIYHYSGTFNTGGKTMVIGGFVTQVIQENAVRGLSFENSTIIFYDGGIDFTGDANLTHDMSGSNIILAGNAALFRTAGTGYQWNFYNIKNTNRAIEFYLNGGYNVNTFNKIESETGMVFNAYTGNCEVDTLILAPGMRYRLSTYGKFIINEEFIVGDGCGGVSCGCVIETLIQSYSLTNVQATISLGKDFVIVRSTLTGIDVEGPKTLTVNNAYKDDGTNNANVIINKIVTEGPGDFYWVGGSGYWRDPKHWSIGVPNGDPAVTNASCFIPSAQNRVFFTEHSFNNINDTVWFDFEQISSNNISASVRSMFWLPGSDDKKPIIGAYGEQILRVSDTLQWAENVSFHGADSPFSNRVIVTYSSINTVPNKQLIITNNINTEYIAYVFDGTGRYDVQGDLYGYQLTKSNSGDLYFRDNVEIKRTTIQLYGSGNVQFNKKVISNQSFLSNLTSATLEIKGDVEASGFTVASGNFTFNQGTNLYSSGSLSITQAGTDVVDITNSTIKAQTQTYTIADCNNFIHTGASLGYVSEYSTIVLDAGNCVLNFKEIVFGKSIETKGTVPVNARKLSAVNSVSTIIGNYNVDTLQYLSLTGTQNHTIHGGNEIKVNKSFLYVSSPCNYNTIGTENPAGSGTQATINFTELCEVEFNFFNIDNINIVSPAGCSETSYNVIGKDNGGNDGFSSFTEIGASRHTFEPRTIPCEYIGMGLELDIAIGEGISYAWYEHPITPSSSIVSTEKIYPLNKIGTYQLRMEYGNNCNYIYDQEVTQIVDNNAPVITTVGNVSATANGCLTYLKQEADWNATATDCNLDQIWYVLSGATVASSVSTLQDVLFNVGMTTVTVYARDFIPTGYYPEGMVPVPTPNTATATFTVTVQDPFNNIQILCANTNSVAGTGGVIGAKVYLYKENQTQKLDSTIVRADGSWVIPISRYVDEGTLAVSDGIEVNMVNGDCTATSNSILIQGVDCNLIIAPSDEILTEQTVTITAPDTYSNYVWTIEEGDAQIQGTTNSNNVSVKAGCQNFIMKMEAFFNGCPVICFASIKVNGCGYTVHGTVFPFVNSGDNSFDGLFKVTASLYTLPTSANPFTEINSSTPLYTDSLILYDGSVYVPGTPKNPGAIANTNNPGIAITWSMIGKEVGLIDNTEVGVGEIPESNVGLYTFEDVLAGEYLLVISRPGYITRYAKINVTGDGTLGHRELLAGDINNANNVSVTDLSLLNVNFSIYGTDAFYNTLYDLDGDGFVGARDIEIVLALLRASFLMYSDSYDWLINY